MRVSGRITFSSEVQPHSAMDLMFFRAFGRLMVLRAEHLLNTPSSKLVMVFGRVIVSSPVHSANADAPMVWMLFGI